MDYKKIVYNYISYILIHTKVDNIKVLETLDNEPALICPNHTSRYDGIVMHSVVSRISHARTILMGEAFDKHMTKNPYDQLYLKLLEDFDVKPMHRKKDEFAKTFNDIKECYNYLDDNKKKFLIIYPDGEHVAPNRLIVDKAYLDELPTGAFKIAKSTNKKIIPVFMEPNILFKKTHIVFGTPLDAKDYDTVTSLEKAWYEEIKRLCIDTVVKNNGKINKYTLKRKYRNKFGEIVSDPNERYV